MEDSPWEKKRTSERERFLRRNKEGRKTFWGLVPEGSSHGCSITERANRAEVVPGLKNTFLMVKKRASSAAPTLITCSLSFWVPLFIACDFFFVVLPFFSSSSSLSSTYADGTEISHTRVHFSRSSWCWKTKQRKISSVLPAVTDRVYICSLFRLLSIALLCFALLFLLFCF